MYNQPIDAGWNSYVGPIHIIHNQLDHIFPLLEEIRSFIRKHLKPIWYQELDAYSFDSAKWPKNCPWLGCNHEPKSYLETTLCLKFLYSYPTLLLQTTFLLNYWLLLTPFQKKLTTPTSTLHLPNEAFFSFMMSTQLSFIPMPYLRWETNRWAFASHQFFHCDCM